jgi:histidinol-phosphatase
MGRPSYLQELAFAEELADRAGAMALSFFRHDPEVTWKPDATPVTEADIAVEAMIRDELSRRFPDDAIRGEEGGIEGSSERMWIVDPIDGTRNFAAGIQIWANLLALKVDGEYVMGLANAPALGERYAASKGGGATWNGEPMSVSDVGSTADGMVVLGDLEAWAGTPRGENLMQLVHGARRNRGFGDFWGHMLVARGAAEVMIEPALAEWDFAALSVIVSEAGGRVTQVDGTPPVHGGSLVSSNGLVHDEVIAALRA